MTTDDLGNIYIVNEENALFKFSGQEEKPIIFRSLKHGSLTTIDANNPLQIIAYFSEFAHLLILDNQLSIKSTLNLRTKGFFNTTTIGSSSDGGFWMYDQQESVLIKLDPNLNITQKSNDFRIETNVFPQITSIIESDEYVYLCDTINGLFMLNRHGRFLNQIPEIKSKSLQVINKQLIYLQENEILIYNQQSFSKKSITLSSKEKVLDARVQRNRLILLYSNKMEIYSLEE